MVTIAPEAPAVRSELIHRLAAAYRYEPWRVRIFDMQRASVDLPAPPADLLPADLGARYHMATAVWQANGFAFTTSEASSVGHVSTPYLAVAQPSRDGRCRVSLTDGGEPVPEFEDVHLVELMGRPSVHYFPFRGADGRRLHDYLIVNPLEGCAFRCKYCSRLPYFGTASPDHRGNLARTVAEVRRTVESPERIKFVNVITGSQRTGASDVEMFADIVGAFRSAGFGHCEYGVYTASVQDPSQMKRLRDMGVVFFTLTLETATDAARTRLHERGNPKHLLSAGAATRVLQEAERIFPHVNATFMLGYDPADDVKSVLAGLAAATRVTVNHYIPRIWLRGQHDLLHPEARRLEYYVDLSAFIEREVNAGRQSVSAFFAQRFGIEPFRLRYRS